MFRFDDAAKIVSAFIPASMLTVNQADRSISFPGALVYWDDQDPDNQGWAYREAQGFDPDTMIWDGQVSGELDHLDEVLKLAVDSANRMAGDVVTDDQIERLSNESAAAGDLPQTALCLQALTIGDRDARHRCARVIIAATADRIADEMDLLYVSDR